MTGWLVDGATTIMCAHGGRASATRTNPRVRRGGTASLTVAMPLQIAGCALPPTRGGPCTSATWLTENTRVTAGGQPLVTSGSTSVCIPTGTPLAIVPAPTRVAAT